MSTVPSLLVILYIFGGAGLLTALYAKHHLEDRDVGNWKNMIHWPDECPFVFVFLCGFLAATTGLVAPGEMDRIVAIPWRFCFGAAGGLALLMLFPVYGFIILFIVLCIIPTKWRKDEEIEIRSHDREYQKYPEYPRYPDY